jgi:hypothetical protein
MDPLPFDVFTCKRVFFRNLVNLPNHSVPTTDGDGDLEEPTAV